LEAEILLEYKNEDVASVIANAVSPDNFKTPKGLTVNTVCSNKEVITKVKCKGKFQTFISTIDDLLFCVSVAERSLGILRKKGL
jgi:tRNA threonylcarbamoyladenosine modification (KEOPS) complex  Pcc1 subunit